MPATAARLCSGCGTGSGICPSRSQRQPKTTSTAMETSSRPTQTSAMRSRRRNQRFKLGGSSLRLVHPQRNPIGSNENQYVGKIHENIPGQRDRVQMSDEVRGDINRVPDPKEPKIEP